MPAEVTELTQFRARKEQAEAAWFCVDCGELLDSSLECRVCRHTEVWNRAAQLSQPA